MILTGSLGNLRFHLKRGPFLFFYPSPLFLKFVWGFLFLLNVGWDSISWWIKPTPGCFSGCQPNGVKASSNNTHQCGRTGAAEVNFTASVWEHQAGFHKSWMCGQRSKVQLGDTKQTLQATPMTFPILQCNSNIFSLQSKTEPPNHDSTENQAGRGKIYRL